MSMRFPTTEELNAVPGPLSDIELARMWRTLATAPTPPPLRRPSRKPLFLGISLLSVALATSALALVRLAGREEPAPAAAPEGPADRSELELPDGSRVLPGPDTRLKVVSSAPRDVALLLLRGGAEIAVPKVAAETRRFVVAVGDFYVIAQNAHFRVALGGSAPDRRVEVAVLAGQIEIHRQAGDRRPPIMLAAGETWANDAPSPTVPN